MERREGQKLNRKHHSTRGHRADNVGKTLDVEEFKLKVQSNNLKSLMESLHKGTYRPQPKRRVEIPKSNGKMRPIAIASFEDKLVEWVLNKIISTTYEPLFIQQSNAFSHRRLPMNERFKVK
jgi:retron-type reverse transcriptase